MVDLHCCRDVLHGSNSWSDWSIAMKNDNNSKLEVIQQSANLRHQRAAGAFTLSRFNLFFFSGLFPPNFLEINLQLFQLSC